MQKLSVALGLRDRLEKSQANMFDDMLQKFKSNQGLFKGQRNTYEALEGYADDSTKRNYTHVSSTVDEQLAWLKTHSMDYLENVLSVEKTNSTGVKAILVVDGKEWGEYSTLELLRMKSILDGKFKAILHDLPVRKDTVIWTKSNDPNFEGREVYETPLEKGFARTTKKSMEIINDPHIKDAPGRPPIPQNIEKVENIGQMSHQDFSGEYTLKQRADLMVKQEKLYLGIIEALAKANETEVQLSDLGQKALDYLLPTMG